MDTQEKEFVDYCGENVTLLDMHHTAYGNIAVIQFEDGREDEVPISTINFK